MKINGVVAQPWYNNSIIELTMFLHSIIDIFDKPLGTSSDDSDGALLIPPPLPMPGDSDPALFSNTTEADYNATLTSISHDFTDCCNGKMYLRNV
uniref:Uncharacterized protein n=1 Tax=Megaselia scalaris TaxID=36166 RepID=T1H4T9_MEGSC